MIFSQASMGAMASLATAVCWTISPIVFEKAGKRVGSLAVNYMKAIFAFGLIGIYCLVTRGNFLPVDATMHNWVWLTISGLIGFVLGDLFLFQAYIEIGARLSMLIMAMVPIISALADYLITGQVLNFKDLIGILVTLGGIALVILVKGDGKKKIKLSHPIKGFLYALIGALGQAFGLIFSKVGMGSYNAFAATQIRLLAAILGFAIVILVSGKGQMIKAAFRDKYSVKIIAFGSFFGPSLGVSLSLLALQLTATGIASTIMSLSRILVIPISVTVFHERVTAKEYLGAFISIVGVAILIL